ncbi:RodZ domain-containing protein [Shewanella sp. 0m-8]
MKNEQNQEPNVDNESLVDEPTLTLGVLLKTARENKGLSIEAIASQLHLRPIIVKQIEADNLQEVGAATYVRGYVKNYARAVQADPFIVQQCLDKQLESDEKPSMQSFSRKTTRQARDGRLMALTYIIVFVLLGLMVLWWFQKSSMDAAVDYSQPTAEEVAASAEVDLVSPIDVVLVDDSDTGIEQIALSDADSSASAEQNASTADSSAQPEAASIPNTQIQTAPLSATQETELALAEPIAQASTESENNALSSTLTLTLTGDCWIKVADANGNVLVSDLKKSGSELILKGAEPFSVTLGAPQVVNIQLNGKAISLEQYPGGKVARMTLPHAGQ